MHACCYCTLTIKIAYFVLFMNNFNHNENNTSSNITLYAFSIEHSQTRSILYKLISNTKMHNRKKLERPPSDAEIAALQKKSQTYASLVQIIFERRVAKDHSADTLQLVGKMLRTNPDFYSLWSFRREVLFSTNPSLSEASFESKYTGDNADLIRDEEMNLSTEGIQRNPKSCTLNL